MGASYDGPALDGTYTHLSEVYSDPNGETVDVVDDTPAGEARVEGVSVPDDSVERPDVDGQSTWGDWGWSA